MGCDHDHSFPSKGLRDGSGEEIETRDIERESAMDSLHLEGQVDVHPLIHLIPMDDLTIRS